MYVFISLCPHGLTKPFGILQQTLFYSILYGPMKMHLIFRVVVILAHYNNFIKGINLIHLSRVDSSFYLKSLDWYIPNKRGISLDFVIITLYKTCSDAPLCGVWSGVTLFAYVPFLGDARHKWIITARLWGEKICSYKYVNKVMFQQMQFT